MCFVLLDSVRLRRFEIRPSRQPNKVLKLFEYIDRVSYIDSEKTYTKQTHAIHVTTNV